MGTSSSSPGSGGSSPLVAPWADDQPERPLPPPEPRRFAQFRMALGQAIAKGSREDLTKALGYYASKATGGNSIAARNMGSVIKSGASLFGVLSGLATTSEEVSFDLKSLEGLSCEQAISTITQAPTPQNGDTDKIRSAMNYALVEALDGIDTFDPQQITDEMICNTMINYLSESILLQIVMDSGKAWNKAETSAQALQAESDLREMIKVCVDKHMATKLNNNVRLFARTEMIQLERQVSIDVWKEWETYQ